jgi:NOL1/NOP2/fmu family ribosome biogenesis protein
MMEAKIRRMLGEEFGITLPEGRFTLEGKYLFFFRGEDLPLSGTRGMHIGVMEEDGIRPTIDACQLATKNLVDVDEKEATRWMCGIDLEKEAKGRFVIIRFGKYILGPGKPRGGRILNNLPKNRRLPLRCMG